MIIDLIENNPIIWTGDLDDDCLANWNGLILRAEWMDSEYWWWAVSVDDGRVENIDDSSNYDISPIDGDSARKLAEQAAIKYIKEQLNRQ